MYLHSIVSISYKYNVPGTAQLFSAKRRMGSTDLARSVLRSLSSASHLFNTDVCQVARDAWCHDPCWLVFPKHPASRVCMYFLTPNLRESKLVSVPTCMCVSLFLLQAPFNRSQRRSGQSHRHVDASPGSILCVHRLYQPERCGDAKKSTRQTTAQGTVPARS